MLAPPGVCDGQDVIAQINENFNQKCDDLSIFVSLLLSDAVGSAWRHRLRPCIPARGAQTGGISQLRIVAAGEIGPALRVLDAVGDDTVAMGHATPDDLQGLTFSIGGPGGEVLLKLGVVAQQPGATDVAPAPERGVINGAEQVGRHEDENRGCHRVTQFYGASGWRKTNSQSEV